MKNTQHRNYKLSNLPASKSNAKVKLRKILSTLVLTAFIFTTLFGTYMAYMFTIEKINFTSQAQSKNSNLPVINNLDPLVEQVVSHKQQQDNTRKVSIVYFMIVVSGFSLIILSAIFGKSIKYLSTK